MRITIVAAVLAAILGLGTSGAQQKITPFIFTCVVFDQKQARTVLKGQIEAQQFKKWFKEDYPVEGERIEPPADAIAFGCLVVTDGEEILVMPLYKWGKAKQLHFACQLHEIGRAPMFSVVTDSEEALVQKMKAALAKMEKAEPEPERDGLKPAR
jgi:hypothetical protein